ncbi:MAG: leucine-rich repeat domain-containing protein [Limnothrix sp.]
MAQDKGYQIAEKRIEAALKEGATELDLSELGLTEVPGSIAKLTNLTSLNLSGNQITEIPKAIAQLTNLTELYLHKNQITEIPEAITQLTNLTELYLHNNQITEISQAITQLTNLTVLYFFGNQITEIPQAITQLTNLIELHLGRNQITEIPQAITQLTNLTLLYLSANQITEIPETITNLTNLTELYLSENQITEIPETITNLTNLTRLDLDNNQITEIPKAISNLINLKVLTLQNNQITDIPEAISNLTNLITLSFHGNQIAEIPEAISNLTNLTELWFSENQIAEIPKAITNLTNLTRLDLDNNQITEIPKTISNLTNLKTLFLHDNPLNPILQSACSGGIEELFAYLNSLQDVSEIETLHEAKLVLIGEGDVGKTTLLKALTGKDPQKGEETTHGISIDIQALSLPHPDQPDTHLTFNAWDFGGQEVYRITHQFFFSKRAVYLLLWEPRRGVQQCQVEDWLNMLQLRVGEAARVIIVSTHCKTGNRIARIDQPVLRRDYGDMIVDFLEVDSLEDDPDTGEKFGIVALKNRIADTAKTFDQMGAKLNRAWRESRDELLAIKEPRITYTEFAAVCENHGLSEIATRTLADLMHDLGYIVYYGDDESLKDDVILQPEWLTKAIGFVLEDRTTQEMDGILPDNRLKAVLYDHPFTKEPRYSPEFYPFFLRLMEKYDVSYRLEDGTASLVSQHVPQVRPALPWLPEEDPEPNRRRIAMVCVMEESPPGLIPWMIVRTHEYIYKRHENDGKEHRLHWQKGMFLRYKSHGKAMLELRDREFHIYTEAVWPEHFAEILQQTLHTLITDTWPGLEGRYHFAIPCPTKKDNRDCMGRFEISALREFVDDGDTHYRCQSCRTRHKIEDLLIGFKDDSSREQLNRIETKVDQGFSEIQNNLAEWESRIANYTMGIMRAIANEAKNGPRLFTLEPVDGNWRRLFDKRYRLHLWCEAENCQHRVHQPDFGVYEFNVSKDWVTKVAPYANLVARVLKTTLPVAIPAANLYFGEDIMDNWAISQSLDAMKEATGNLLENDMAIAEPRHLKDGILTEAERSGILALHSFLREEDPHHQRLGLKRMPTYTGDYLWLCETHYQAAQSIIPDHIE